MRAVQPRTGPQLSSAFRVGFQVCTQSGDEHTSPQCLPVQVEEAVFIAVPSLWEKPISGPRPQLLPESPNLGPLLHQAWRCAQVIFDFLQHNIAAGFQITADLPGQQYTFLQDNAPTDLRPDIVMWSMLAIYLVKLTVLLETNIAGAAERKVHCYREIPMPVETPTCPSSLWRSDQGAFSTLPVFSSCTD